MSTQVSFPLDNDGFLRRECPTCDRQFKWHNGPANEEAEQQMTVDAYFCPFCGQAAAVDQWWTAEQVQHIQGVALPAALQTLDDELASAFKGMNSKHVKFKKTGHLDIPDEPDPLTEPDDMVIVASPCHGWEPVKVPEDTTSPLYCLICGQAFAL
jgi:hypothetical protein